MTGLRAPSEEASGAVPADSTPRRLDLSLQLLASGVTTRTVALAVVTSLMAGGVGRLQTWPLWAIVLAMVVPAVPVLASPAVQLRRHDGALALFYLLVLAQAGHVLEHLAQVTQLHVLHHTGEEAHGVFGALDVEWVHFIWNAVILVAAVFLLRHYRRNVWLWFALALAGWHQVEHTYIMSVYLQTAQMGTPGLLAAGGALGGGLPLRRPDLHFVYNVLETTPLVLAFLHQVGQLAGARQAAVITESMDSDQLTALLPQPRGMRLAPRTKSQQKARSRQRDIATGGRGPVEELGSGWSPRRRRTGPSSLARWRDGEMPRARFCRGSARSRPRRNSSPSCAEGRHDSTGSVATTSSRR